MNNAILLISCPDQKGITASVTSFIFQNDGNILHADQHIDEQSGTFFMRVEWSLDGFRLTRELIKPSFEPLARRFKMNWELSFTDEPLRVAIFVSRSLHCLFDLLYRYRYGQLSCRIPLIVSNHPDGRNLAESLGIEYVEMAVLKENKIEQERRQGEILRARGIDLVILARYHQILTPSFVRAFPHGIINIHHSFLPAFVGKNPYYQACERGVKIIGATSHFVTEALDEGPIIEQDTVEVSHRDSLEDLKRKGEDLEKIVLNRALRLALEKKILCYNNKTVIFD